MSQPLQFVKAQEAQAGVNVASGSPALWQLPSNHPDPDKTRDPGSQLTLQQFGAEAFGQPVTGFADHSLICGLESKEKRPWACAQGLDFIGYIWLPDLDSNQGPAD